MKISTRASHGDVGEIDTGDAASQTRLRGEYDAIARVDINRCDVPLMWIASGLATIHSEPGNTATRSLGRFRQPDPEQPTSECARHRGRSDNGRSEFDRIDQILMPLSPGDQLGPYEIVAPIAAGGMGEVYSARDGRLGRK